ncbi:MAG: hypothetical protein H7326_03940 [Bdellovibrionaceae bacterium]|nr:hypothetical protein [Pseudobdellovibrionaceae bacterium]
MKQLALVFLLAILHTLPLWNWDHNLAGGAGDPFAHAAIGEWYCKNVVLGNFKSDIFMAPFGTDLSGSYDSPFPFILTCPFYAAGPIFQFHLFTFIQIAMILLSAFLVARTFFKHKGLQLCYILFVWWCGFYVVRSHQHITLLSVIWGFQLVLYALWTFNPGSWRRVAVPGALIGLALTGTFYNIASLFFISLILIFVRLWQTRKDFIWKSLLYIPGGVLSFLVVFLPLWGPLIYFTLWNGAPDVIPQRAFYNLDLLSPFIPFDGNWLSQFFGGDLRIGFERYNPFEPIMLILAIFWACHKKFWKDGWKATIFILSIFYFILALGPELRFNNDAYFDLNFNKLVLDFFPFRLSRTPARFAAITNLSFVFLGFMFLDQISRETWKNWIAVGLLGWIVLTGPGLNNMWQFPTLEYPSLFARQGLASLKALPDDSVVISIPSAWAQDPTQNFNRLFHRKNISSAYLSYPAYNQKTIALTVPDPFLGKLGCAGEITAYKKNDLMSNPAELQKHLKERKFRGFMINKQILSGQANCAELTQWVLWFVKLPWIRVTEENANFVTAEML